MEVSDFLPFLCVGISLVLGIINLCWLCSYYICKEYDAIRSRRPLSSIMWGICWTMSYLIINPMFLLFTNATSTILPFYDWYLIMNNAISVIIMGPTIFTLSYRVYMIYFDIKWMTALQDKQWRLHIDPQEKNWFLKNKNSFGNTKKVAIVFCIQWIIFVILSMLLSVLDFLYAKAFNALIAVFHIIFAFILYCKWPKYSDSWYISNEIKLFLKFYCFGMFFYIILYIILLNAPVNSYAMQYAYMIPSSVVGISMNYIAFCYPLKKFNYKTNPCSAIAHQSMSETETMMSVTVSSKNVVINKIGIKQILENKHGFNEFARHLTSEWCIENLLFFVETQQWIVSLSSKKKYSDLNTDKKIILKYPENAPISRIIELNDEYLEIVQLYEKYLKNDADFSINISFTAKYAIYNKLNVGDNKSNKDIVESLKTLSSDVIFDIFDEARFEIFQLMQGSATRFKNTDQYTRVCQEITE